MGTKSWFYVEPSVSNMVREHLLIRLLPKVLGRAHTFLQRNNFVNSNTEAVITEKTKHLKQTMSAKLRHTRHGARSIENAGEEASTGRISGAHCTTWAQITWIAMLPESPPSSENMQMRSKQRALEIIPKLPQSKHWLLNDRHVNLCDIRHEGCSYGLRNYKL